MIIFGAHQEIMLFLWLWYALGPPRLNISIGLILLDLGQAEFHRM